MSKLTTREYKQIVTAILRNLKSSTSFKKIKIGNYILINFIVARAGLQRIDNKRSSDDRKEIRCSHSIYKYKAVNLWHTKLIDFVMLRKYVAVKQYSKSSVSRLCQQIYWTILRPKIRWCKSNICSSIETNKLMYSVMYKIVYI